MYVDDVDPTSTMSWALCPQRRGDVMYVDDVDPTSTTRTHRKERTRDWRLFSTNGIPPVRRYCSFPEIRSICF